jgi:deoxyribodipyrimidine photo-lyase
VPSAVFGRTFVLLHHFRPKLRAELEKYLVPVKKIKVKHKWTESVRSYSLEKDITEGFGKLDRSVGPVDVLIGGTKAGLARLKEFTDTQLRDYEKTRNHPEMRGTSQVSPYLHYGHLSPITIALAVRKAGDEGKASKETCEKFLDELIGWRELSVLFCKHNPNYDNWECAEPWARKSLEAHAGDKRPWTYTYEQLEKAETHDPLWNAAQRQMTETGWMHNYVRMYWGKKILEWAPTPE